MDNTTTKRVAWLGQLHLLHYGEVTALYDAIKHETEHAGFTAVREDNGLIVSAPGVTQKLLISSAATKEALLEEICSQYVPPGMDIETWAAVERIKDREDDRDQR